MHLNLIFISNVLKEGAGRYGKTHTVHTDALNINAGLILTFFLHISWLKRSVYVASLAQTGASLSPAHGC